jgi:hypothetical protein
MLMLVFVQKAGDEKRSKSYAMKQKRIRLCKASQRNGELVVGQGAKIRLSFFVQKDEQGLFRSKDNPFFFHKEKNKIQNKEQPEHCKVISRHKMSFRRRMLRDRVRDFNYEKRNIQNGQS